MKPPETVTLIDLEGNVLEVFDTNRTHFYKHCSINTYEDSGGYYVTKLKRGETDYHRVDENSWDDSIPYQDLIKKRELVDFLNDQLTFIRNGMWETLAIYQATLGRYWEVPWFEATWKEVCNFRAKQKIKGHCYKQSSHKHKFRPDAKDFCKHYPDVFSKLTPWKGE
jgi:hypothetical protein